MTRLSQNQINKKARDVLVKHNALSVPIKLDVLTQRLGLSLVFTELGEEVSGLLIVDDDDATIGVNEDHPTVRQRFTIAHEIGHFILHSKATNLFIDKKYNAIYRDKQSATGQDWMEVQANRFAAALLMPKELIEEKLIEEEIDIVDDSSIKALAGLFEVSSQALTFRLLSLGYLENPKD